MVFRVRQGMALVNVLMFTFFTTVFLIVGSQFIQGAVKHGRKSNSSAQVYNVALAGINHAVQWLQKQSNQPVLVFDPKVADPALNPDEESETAAAEENLGLVHEFTIDPNRNLWGRYEVGRSSWAPSPAPTRSPNVGYEGAYSPLYASDALTWTAEDVSRQRGAADNGLIWRIRSRGYIFERDSASTPFSPSSPKPLEQMTLQAEVKLTAFKFPTAALYSFSDGDNDPEVDFNDNNGGKPTLRVDDGTARNYWLHTDDTSPETLSDDCDCGSSPLSSLQDQSNSSSATFVDPSLSAQLAFVFGTSDLDAIRSMADAYYNNNNDVPTPLPAMSFVYIKPSGGGQKITFNGSKVLAGGGILFVEGNLKLDGNSVPQDWDGLIFVTGNYEQLKTSTVTGSVMVGRKITMDADGVKVPSIIYSANQLDLVNRQLGNYRLERSTIKVVEDDGSLTF